MDQEDFSYWKGRKWRSLFLVFVLAIPIAGGLWLAYEIVRQAGQIIYEIVLVISNGNASSFTVIDAVVSKQITPHFSLWPALFSIFVFIVFAWILERKTKTKIFWWYPALIALFELSRFLLLPGLEAFFVALFFIVTLIAGISFLRIKKGKSGM